MIHIIQSTKGDHFMGNKQTTNSEKSTCNNNVCCCAAKGGPGCCHSECKCRQGKDLNKSKDDDQ